jgi:predicted DNA-binding antitoxin AbrB/MazE fold protein
MVHTLQAVFEHGVLKPIEPLHLKEHQLVSVIVTDDLSAEDALFEPPSRFEALADRSISRDAVRKALAKIPGSMEADFAAERDER